ncbi:MULTISPECIES: response regulator transcription factor [unclassified Streptomyces]|uniref:response regulator transcription factor n=1 Tax=unclassified Streptomyces TaxID=2593676 RepID=UPI0033A17244
MGDGTGRAVNQETVRILVADDHALLREALCGLLRSEPGFEVVAQAGSGTETVRLAAQHRPDVVVLDIEMPENDPATTVRRLLGQDPSLRVIVLSMYDDQPLVRELLSEGISGYLHKSTGRETLVSAIRERDTSARRRVTLSVSVESFDQQPPRTVGPGDLSARELQVLACVADALSNRQIAGRLGIAESTVKRHIQNIFAKLDAVSRIDAVNKATARSLIPAPLKPGGRRPAP